MRFHSVVLKYAQGQIYTYTQYVLYMMLKKNVQHEAQTSIISRTFYLIHFSLSIMNNATYYLASV
jgi:hypothetical protein